MTPLSTLHPTYEAEGGAVAWTDGLVLMSWHGAPAIEQARAIRLAAREVRQASATDVATVAFFEGGFPFLSEGVRREVNALTQETKAYSRGTALVMTSAGFATAVVRSFLASAMHLARTKEALAAFSTPGAAIDWVFDLYETGTAPWTRAELAANVEGFLTTRALYGAKP